MKFGALQAIQYILGKMFYGGTIESFVESNFMKAFHTVKIYVNTNMSYGGVEKTAKVKVVITDESLITMSQIELFDFLLPGVCDTIDSQLDLTYALFNHDKGPATAYPEFEHLNTKSLYESLTSKKFWFENIRKCLIHGSAPSDYFEGGILFNGESVSEKNISTGTNDYSDSGTMMVGLFPNIKNQTKYPCECPNDKTSSVYNIIIHLNDTPKSNLHGKEWTREEIADWLESLDFKIEAKENAK